MDVFVIGIDLGATKVEACLLDRDRRIIERRRIPAQSHLSVEKVNANIAALAENVASGRTIAAVGIGTPGTYFSDIDRIFGAANSPLYETKGFITQLKTKFSCPLVVENDANCLALGEYFNGLNKVYSHVLAVILGTGLGGGLILDRKLYRGKKGNAAEIGHMSIDFEGRICGCGRRGCAEAYLSGPSLRARYNAVSGNDLPPSEIYLLAEDGDSVAVKFFEESCRILGGFLGNLVTGLDLDAIVLGGGVSNLPVWYDKVPAHLNAATFGYPREVPIIKAALGDSAGVVGAAFLALRQIGAMDF